MIGKLCIIGASGHARDCLDVALEMGYRDIVFAELDRVSARVPGFTVLEDSLDTIAALRAEERQFFIGIGDPRVRRAVGERMADCQFPALIHPVATFGRDMRELARMSPGLFIAAGARIGNTVKFGAHCLVNLNAVVAHDCVLDDYASVMPGAVVCGHVALGAGCYIGANASIVQGTSEKPRVIGANAIVGAGAIVTRDVPAGATTLCRARLHAPIVANQSIIG